MAAMSSASVMSCEWRSNVVPLSRERRAHSRSDGLRHGVPLVGCSGLLGSRLGWYIAA
jgi:hypothetical protein